MYNFNYGYDDSFILDSTADVFATMAIVFVVIMLLALTWEIVKYIFQSIGYYKIAKNHGISAPWLAFVPLANVWLYGKVAEKFDETKGMKHPWSIVMSVLCGIELIGSGAFISIYASIISFVVQSTMNGYVTNNEWVEEQILGKCLSLIPVAIVFAIATTGLAVVSYICLNKMFELTKPKNSIALLLVSILIPVTAPFIIFACRNYDNNIDLTKIVPVQPMYNPAFNQPQNMQTPTETDVTTQEQNNDNINE